MEWADGKNRCDWVNLQNERIYVIAHIGIHIAANSVEMEDAVGSATQIDFACNVV